MSFFFRYMNKLFCLMTVVVVIVVVTRLGRFKDRRFTMRQVERREGWKSREARA